MIFVLYIAVQLYNVNQQNALFKLMFSLNFAFEFPCILSLYYIKHQQMQLWQYCLLVTAILLYMFRTLSASIIRST